MRGIRVAAIVGPILIALNHWDTLLYGQVTGVIVTKMILTPLIPFCVSVYSSVSTIMRRQRIDSGEE
jgi:hypothetical protein